MSGPLAALPAEKLYQAPAAGEWSLMENIAHILEFMPYWADEFTKMVANPRQKIGRTLEDAGRLQAIQAHGHDSLTQARSALAISYAHLDRALCTFYDSDLYLTANHATKGTQTLTWFIDEFIVQHLTQHIAQIRSGQTTIETGEH